MKKTSLILAMLLSISIGLLANTKTIINPAYDFKSCGIYDVTKIELTDTATLLTIHNDFVPHWWVQFNDYDVIRDCDTGTEYKIKGIQGAVLNEMLWMPASGDSTVVLIFPPLPSSVKKIDFQKSIFGISLDESKAGVRMPTMLPEIENWIDTELAKSKSKPITDFHSPEFFNEAPARLIGCIKGYDPRADFATGIVYASNEFTREDFPVVAQIQPNGRFEVDIPMNTPKHTWILINDQWMLNFYIEPGQTLAMVLDWDEFLEADRRRNIRYQFKHIEFKGTLATINHELLSYTAPQPDYNSLQEKRNTMAPLDYKADQEKVFESNLNNFNDYLKSNEISDKAKTLLRNSIVIDHATLLFDFVMNRDYYAKQDSTNEILKMPVPDSYYDFLQKLDLNDQSLLAVNRFSAFINRFEYCELFRKAQGIAAKKTVAPKIEPEKSLLEYFTDEQVELTNEEHDLLRLWGKTQLNNDEMSLMKEKEEVIAQFNAKHKDKIQVWADKYIAPLYKKDMGNREIEVWKAKDSILIHDLVLNPNLAYDIAKIRSLNFSFKNADSKEKANELWGFLKQGISTPYLIQTGDRLLNYAFPEVEIASTPLPESAGADVFRKLIEPYKGKILFVDFWATTCGPCLSGIKNMKAAREKYAGNPDFEFVFITDERGSPEKNYNDFVSEQELKNIYRIPKDDFNYLRELFKFNGIPRYVVIDRNGHVINDNFSMYNFETELAILLPKYKK